MNEVKLTELSIKDSRDLLNRKDISAKELTSAYIQNIQESSKLNAFIEKTFDKLLHKHHNLYKNLSLWKD